MNVRLSAILLVIFLASPMMAQDAAHAAAGGTNWTSAAALIAMAIASGLCGLAQGKAVAGATEALARNPGAAGGIRFLALLGLVLIESMALYTFVLTFLKN